MRPLLILTLLAIAAPAAAKTPPQTPDEKLAAALKGLHPNGKPMSCVSVRDLQDTTIVAPDTIVYHDGPGAAYVNHLRDSCPAMDADSIIVSHNTIDQTCSGDPIHIVDQMSHFDQGTCVLGDFQPYSRK